MYKNTSTCTQAERRQRSHHQESSSPESQNGMEYKSSEYIDGIESLLAL